jgi:hypothetical protein
MRDDLESSIPGAARWLGFAGLLPQIAVVSTLMLLPPEMAFPAKALGFAYAALILSFLGGLWWGLAAPAPRSPSWIYVAAVVPSLFALAATIPWAVGLEWPGPSLVALGIAIGASMAVDRRLVADGIAPRWWLSLRVPLSAGLGTLTVVAGLLS